MVTWDGSAEPVSRAQIILRRKRGQGKLISPVQMTTVKIGNHTRSMSSLLKGMIIQYLHLY